MSAELFFDILDDKRRDILSSLAPSKHDFYLAGGTGLALQIGHRDSIDFDFFKEGSFSTEELSSSLSKELAGHDFMPVQQERNTLTVLIDGDVKVSFFGYEYPLLLPAVTADVVNIASIEDIGCMKLAAIIGRSMLKDYIDLFFLIKHISLQSLLDLAARKYPRFNATLALKSLAYFDDIVDEPILFKHGFDVSIDDVKLYLVQQVKKTVESGWV